MLGWMAKFEDDGGLNSPCLEDSHWNVVDVVLFSNCLGFDVVLLDVTREVIP